jgi:hypothetical protein
MPTLEEMTAWSLEEIRGEVKRLLTKGWSFSIVWDQEEQIWFAQIERDPGEDEGPDPVVVWSGFGPDEKILLFNVYGWLWLKIQPKPQGASPWVRKRELTTVGVTRKALGIPDPEDVDPEEVLSVYKSVRNK